MLASLLRTGGISNDSFAAPFFPPAAAAGFAPRRAAANS